MAQRSLGNLLSFCHRGCIPPFGTQQRLNALLVPSSPLQLPYLGLGSGLSTRYTSHSAASTARLYNAAHLQQYSKAGGKANNPQNLKAGRPTQLYSAARHHLQQCSEVRLTTP